MRTTLFSLETASSLKDTFLGAAQIWRFHGLIDRTPTANRKRNLGETRSPILKRVTAEPISYDFTGAVR